jgi:hypothetical protein
LFDCCGHLPRAGVDWSKITDFVIVTLTIIAPYFLHRNILNPPLSIDNFLSTIYNLTG